MGDGERLQFAQQFELVDIVGSGAELKDMNWIHVQPNLIRENFVCHRTSGSREGKEGGVWLTEYVEIADCDGDINEELGGFKPQE